MSAVVRHIGVTMSVRGNSKGSFMECCMLRRCPGGVAIHRGGVLMGIPWQRSLRGMAVIREARHRPGLYFANTANPLTVLSSLWGLPVERVSQIGGV